MNRIVKGVRAGKGVEDVFPRLRSVATSTTGSSGVNIRVRFVKKGGAPVTYVAADDPAQAAAVREVDLQRKYHRSANELADAVGLKRNKATALRRSSASTTTRTAGTFSSSAPRKSSATQTTPTAA